MVIERRLIVDEKSLRLTELMPGATRNTKQAAASRRDRTHVEDCRCRRPHNSTPGNAIAQGVGLTDEMRTNSSRHGNAEGGYERALPCYHNGREDASIDGTAHQSRHGIRATGDLDRAEASLNKALQSDQNSLSL